jgi:hypothetical protein
MKSLVSIIVMMAISFVGMAQEEIAMIQNTYGIEKRKLVSDYMEIPQAQATAFWSTYDDYEVERRELGRDRLMLIEEYSKNYTSLTDDKADELAKGILSNNLKLDKFRQSYYGKFKKVTSAKTAAQFMQLELYLEGVIKSEIQNQIPFIGEVEKLRKH